MGAADTEPMRPSDLQGRYTISDTIGIPEVPEPSLPDTEPRGLPSGMHERGKLGRFDILDILGQGGMGVVIAAYDPQLDRKVAIKVLKTQGLTGRRREKEAARLLREARAMAQLSHPHVVTVYEAGEIDERVYIAMEYIAGQTLRRWHEERPRSTAETIDAYAKAGRGLAAGHHAGLIHRDFKPDNVLVGFDGRVRVIDFGLARPARQHDTPMPDDTGEVKEDSVDPRDPLGRQSSSKLHARLTTVGSLFGTPLYMAPEQHKKLELDARADQFAFCVALYEALYGEMPFKGDSYVELAYHVCEGMIRIPPDKPDIPKHVVDAVLRGLKPAPEDRFPDMLELLDALQPAPKRKRMWIWMGAAAIAAAAVTLLGVRLLGSSPEASTWCELDHTSTGVWDPTIKERVKTAMIASGRTHARDSFKRVDYGMTSYVNDWNERQRAVCEIKQTEAQFEARTQCLDRRLGEVHALVDVLGRADPEIADHAVAAVHSLQTINTCMTAKPDALTDPVHAAQIERYWADMANLRISAAAGRYGTATAQAKQLLVLARSLASPTYEADVGLWLGQAQAGTNQPAEADATLREALAFAAKAKDDLLAAQLWILRIHVLGVNLGKYDEALQLETTAKLAIDRAEGDDYLVSQLAFTIGNVLFSKGDYKPAITQYERALDLAIKSRGEEQQQIPQTLNSLAGAYLRSGNVFQAKATLERALALARKLFGPSHPDTAVIQSTLGALAQAFGNWDEATKHHTEALKVLEEVYGPKHEQVGMLYYSLAVSANGREDYKTALPLYQRALAIFESVSPTHPYVGLSLVGTADCLEEVGNPQQGAIDGERALKLLADVKDPVQQAMAKFILAKALWASGGDKVRAKKLATEARAGFKAGGFVAIAGLAAVEKWFLKVDGKQP